MEFAVAAFQAAGPAASTAGTAITGATGVAGAAGGTSALSTAFTVLGMGANILSGIQQQNALDSQAYAEDLRAQQEEVKGQQQENAIRAELIKTMAQNRVAMAASGLSLSSASGQNAQDQARSAANRELSVARSDSELSASLRRHKARMLRSEGDSAFAGGVLRAGQGLLGSYMRTQRRGEPE